MFVPRVLAGETLRSIVVQDDNVFLTPRVQDGQFG